MPIPVTVAAKEQRLKRLLPEDIGLTLSRTGGGRLRLEAVSDVAARHDLRRIPVLNQVPEF